MKKIPLAIALLILSVIGFESFLFLSRTPEKIAARATDRFLEECTSRHLDPKEFEGPRSLPQGNGFVWKRKATGEQILVSVDYFPIRSESWYLPGQASQ